MPPWTAYNRTENTERGPSAEAMDLATLIPGAPAVVKNKYRQTVPSVSQVLRNDDSCSRCRCCCCSCCPLLLALALVPNNDDNRGATTPAQSTESSVTMGICEEGLFTSLVATKSPIQSKVAAAKMAVEMEDTVSSCGSGGGSSTASLSLSLLFVGSEAAMAPSQLAKGLVVPGKRPSGIAAGATAPTETGATSCSCSCSLSTSPLSSISSMS
mmetsp:Transcript_19541/g.41122  ORF Transcript_19541/g.41122 Transcript_19541/m.41122 type:complete len:213 (+) Transcript_19541:79-717(+)